MPLIYKPKGKANEYSEWAMNHYKGCSHGCKYCFAAGMAARFGQVESREAFHEYVTPKKTFKLSTLYREAKAKAPHINSRVLLCFTTDPYQDIEEFKRLTELSVECFNENGSTIHVAPKRECIIAS